MAPPPPPPVPAAHLLSPHAAEAEAQLQRLRADIAAAETERAERQCRRYEQRGVVEL